MTYMGKDIDNIMPETLNLSPPKQGMQSVVTNKEIWNDSLSTGVVSPSNSDFSMLTEYSVAGDVFETSNAPCDSEISKLISENFDRDGCVGKYPHNKLEYIQTPTEKTNVFNSHNISDKMITSSDIPSLKNEKPMIKFSQNDILFGRGGEANNHPGNVRYRALVKQFQPVYLQTKSRIKKTQISRLIVHIICRGKSPGRFLKKNGDGSWCEVDERKAMLKTSQALREDAPVLLGRRKPSQFSTTTPIGCMNIAPNLQDAESVEHSAAKSMLNLGPSRETQRLHLFSPGSEVRDGNSEKYKLMKLGGKMPLAYTYPTSTDPIDKSKQMTFDGNYSSQPNKQQNGFTEINQNDVLFGRGGETNQHKGNIHYRYLVKKNKVAYLQTRSKKMKTSISRSIVDTICHSNPGGRFLKKNSDGLWYEVEFRVAMLKTSQALRENAPLYRSEQYFQNGNPKRPSNIMIGEKAEDTQMAV